MSLLFEPPEEKSSTIQESRGGGVWPLTRNGEFGRTSVVGFRA
jgi:hypothetical protein